MKVFILLFLAIQLSVFSISVAQITFTREWVTGKRSIPPKVKVVLHEDDQSFCRSLIPAIDFLMEAEKAREKICGPHVKAVPQAFVWSRPMQQNEMPNSINSSPPVEFSNTFEGNVENRIRKST